jgi:O-antigen/teichoic acid export membrane protein
LNGGKASAGIDSPRRRALEVGCLWSARVISSLANVSVLAIGANRLSVEPFATFALLVGLVGWLPVLDFGFGSVLQNRVSERRAKGLSQAGLVSACIWGASAMGCVSLVLAVATAAFWNQASGFSFGRYPGAFISTALCLLVSGISMQVHRILAATDRLVLSAAISALQSLLAMLGLYLVLMLSGRSDDIALPLLGYFLPFAAVPALALAGVVPRTEWARRPSGLDVIALFKDSFQFWFVTVLSLVVIQFDQFIAYAYLSARDFAQYAIASKLINFMYFPYSALLVANWSRVSVANAAQDKKKLLGIIHSSIAIGAFYVSGATAALVLLVDPISRVLPRGGGDLDALVLTGVGLVALNKVWTESFALAFLATNRVGVIASYLPFQAGCAVALQLLLVRFWGVYGLMIGGAASYFATSHWILASRAKEVFKTYLPQP